MIIKVRILKTSKNFLTHKGITIISVTQRKHLAECQKVTKNTINVSNVVHTTCERTMLQVLRKHAIHL